MRNLFRALNESKQRGKFRAAGFAAVATVAIATPAFAECSNTNTFVTALGAPLQYTYPLGIGTSLNTILSTINTANTAFLTNSASFVSAPGTSESDRKSGGVWSRAIGGRVETSSTVTSTINNSPNVGEGTCNGLVRQEYAGGQMGVDFATLNLGGGGANIHFGMTGGYLNARSNDITPPSVYKSANLTFNEVGTLKSDTDVGFVGLYTTFSNKGFFADAQVRFDYYRSVLNDPSNSLTDAHLNAYGVAATANAGYNLALGANWFIEPTVGVVWSSTHVDPMRVVSTVPVLFTQFVNNGSLNIDTIESLVGRASLRLGTTVSGGDVTWQPFVVASVFREFAGNATATSIDDASPSTMSLSIDRIGTYAQYGGGTAVIFGNSGWLGYGRFDYKTGDKIEGFNINAGLRYQW